MVPADMNMKATTIRRTDNTRPAEGELLKIHIGITSLNVEADHGAAGASESCGRCASRDRTLLMSQLSADGRRRAGALATGSSGRDWDALSLQ